MIKPFNLPPIFVVQILKNMKWQKLKELFMELDFFLIDT